MNERLHTTDTKMTPALDPILRSLLRCPSCCGELVYSEKVNELSCPTCTFEFPIIDGIPILFPLNVKGKFTELFSRHWDSASQAEKYDRYVEGGQSLLDLHHHRGEVASTLSLVGPLRAGEYVLDCGCGNGRFFQHLPEKVIAVGADASLNLLRICRMKNRYKFLVCCQLENLPLKSSSFDTVICVRVLQHLQKQREAVLEMARVCRSDGQVILHCYNELSSKAVVKHIRESRVGPILNWPFRLLFRSVSPFGKWTLEYDKYSSIFQVRRWFKAAGFKVNAVRGTGFGFNKWFLEGFGIYGWATRHSLTILNKYMAMSMSLENWLGTKWPFNWFMEKFVARATKISKS